MFGLFIAQKSHFLIIDCSLGYRGPANRGLSDGIGFCAGYYDQFFSRILETNYSDPTDLEKISTDPGLTFPNTYMLPYLEAALELLMSAYREDAVHFYEKMQIVVILKATCFGIAYVTIYIIVLTRLMKRLNEEIWLSRAVLNMIPVSVIKKNKGVQNTIWQHRDSSK